MKLSSVSQILAKFERSMKMVAIAPASFDIYLPIRANYILVVWVAVALSILQAMREAGEQDKADTVPTPFFCMLTDKKIIASSGIE